MDNVAIPLSVAVELEHEPAASMVTWSMRAGNATTGFTTKII
jgi:hypothetical protein